MSYLLGAIPLFLSFLLIQAIDNQCDNNDATKCICIKSEEYEYQCPPTELNILIRAKPEESLLIDCLQPDKALDTNLLPNYKSGNTSTVHIGFCQMAQDNFTPLLEKLDVHDIEHFYIRNVSMPFNTSSSRLSKRVFSGLPNLTSLTISRVSDKLDVDILEYLPRLTQFYLENTNISDLSSFQFPSTLTVLHLTGNQLSEVPKNIFKHLSDLKQFHLWRNKITNIYRDDFAGLGSLRSLELSSNSIIGIEEDSFANLTELKTINLGGNKLTKISTTLFKYNKRLTSIRVEHNPGLILSDRIFADLPDLETVNLRDTLIDAVPQNIFENSRNIVTIEMQNNRLTNIPGSTFQQLSKLKKLYLNNNEIKELPNEIFSDLTGLEELFLNNNNLTYINRYLFKNTRNVTVLNLDSNEISEISNDGFYRLEKLEKLILSNNKLAFRDISSTPFSRCFNLKKLVLKKNLIDNFPDINPLTNIEEVDLSYNKIQKIEGTELASAVSPHLRFINLSNNQIQYVDMTFVESQTLLNLQQLDAFHYTALQLRVNINNNPLKCDCGNYPLVRYFQDDLMPGVKATLNLLADDVKCSGPEWYKHMNIVNLKPMNISCKMPFKSCPKECESYWRPYTDFIEIDCSNRNLTYFPKLLSNSTRHKIQMNLNGNLIRGGLNAELGYDIVNELFLSDNKLEELKWIPLGIEVLKLDRNNLTHLEPELLERINKAVNLTKITLSDNPWSCECSARGLQLFMVDHTTKVNSRDVICKDHKYLRDKTDLCRTSSALIMMIVLPVVALLLLSVITLIFYIYYRREVKVWLFAKSICLWFVTEEELDEDKTYDIFISYSNVDEEFVMQNLVSVLESGPKPFKTCIHIRDFEVGEMLMTNITNSVLNSRRTLVVLSNSFLDSVWGIHEFKMAHTQAIKDGRARVVVVKLGDLDESKLDDDIKSYLNTNTYVEWGTSWFWKNLMYALPHSRTSRGGFYKTNQKHADIMLKIDDKYGLTQPPLAHSESTPPVITLDPALLKDHPLNFHKVNAPSSETPLVVDA